MTHPSLVVLTAAHCGSESDADTATAKTFYLLSIKHGEGMKREYAGTRRHELYHDDGKEYDFRIVRLNDSALVDPSTHEPTGANLVELNRDPNIPVVGGEMEIVGFGITEEEGTEMSQDLYDVTVNVVDFDTCHDMYGDLLMPDLMICGGVEGGGKDSCQVSSAPREQIQQQDKPYDSVAFCYFNQSSQFCFSYVNHRETAVVPC
jgi:trypsin